MPQIGKYWIQLDHVSAISDVHGPRNREGVPVGQHEDDGNEHWFEVHLTGGQIIKVTGDNTRVTNHRSKLIEAVSAVEEIQHSPA